MIEPREKLVEDIKYWEERKTEAKRLLEYAEGLLVSLRGALEKSNSDPEAASEETGEMAVPAISQPRLRFPSKSSVVKQLLYVAALHPDFTVPEFIEAQRTAHAKIKARQTVDFHINKLIKQGQLEKVEAPAGRGASYVYRLIATRGDQ